MYTLGGGGGACRDHRYYKCTIDAHVFMVMLYTYIDGPANHHHLCILYLCMVEKEEREGGV